MRRKWGRGRVAWAGCLLIFVGCMETAEQSLGVVVRDSVGVQIVESPFPAWGDGGGWTLSEAPEVRIGVVEADRPDSPYQFFRIADALRLTDGRLAVIDEGAHELRMYSPEGEHLQTVGREGDGPGELRHPGIMYRLPGDSVLVVDFQRMSVFAPNGEFVRRSPRLPSRPTGLFSDGSMLYLAMAPGDAFEPGQVREAQTLVRSWMDPPRADTLIHVSGGEVYRATVGGGLAVYSAPFGKTRMVAVHDDLIYTGDGSAFEVQAIDHNGEVTRIARRADVSRRVTPALIAQHEEHRVENAGFDRQREVLARLFQEWSYPDEYPAYDRLVVDQDGHLWLRHYALGSDEPQEWSVIDGDGRWLGEVLMPRMEVMEIGTDYVLGTTTNELGVEFLTLYRLGK
jgi:hypothetical protein